MEGFSVLGPNADTHATQMLGKTVYDRFLAIAAEVLLEGQWRTQPTIRLSTLRSGGCVKRIRRYLLLMCSTLDPERPLLVPVNGWEILEGDQDTCEVAYRVLSRIAECRSSERGDALNRIREYFDKIQKTVALLANDVHEALAVVVAAVVLLSYVYLYLTGCCAWGGFKAESSGSLDYRDTYIAVLLFRGAYVWIKFRDVAATKPIPGKAVRLIETPCKDGRINKKYEPRFKPQKENGMSFSCMYLGRFDSYADAEVVYRMAASCYDYGKDYGTPLDLAGDGREFFTIIPEFTPEEKTLSGREKQELVRKRVKELYKRYKTQKDAVNLPQTSPGASLEQELQNRRLQSEILSEQQQKEDLAYQLQQCQHLQRAQQSQIQNLQSQVEDVKRQLQHLQQAAQLQVPNLQPEFQLQLCQEQQPEDELFTVAEMSDILNSEPLITEASFVADSLCFWGEAQLMDETTMASPPDFGDNVQT